MEQSVQALIGSSMAETLQAAGIDASELEDNPEL